MDRRELKIRTKEFALRVMKPVAVLPRTRRGHAIAGRLIRTGPAVGASGRASCRARSRAEFVARIGGVEEDAGASAFWMELIVNGGLLLACTVSALLQEANELTAIMAASRISAQRRR